MQLNSYMKTTTNKRLLISKSRDDSNRYTLCREKPDTHDMYAFHDSPRTQHVSFLRVAHVCGKLSLAINKTLLVPRKRALDTICSTLADRSAGSPPSFSPKRITEAVMKAKHLWTTCYIGLLGP
jgi:hypothetical protein